MRNVDGGKLGNLIVSDTERYIIKEKDKLTLYVRSSGSNEPRYCLASGDAIQYNGKQYLSYQPQRKFLRDCLHSAEEIMSDSMLKLGQINSKVRDTNAAFGDSDAQNIIVAQAAQANDRADPQVGQAYVIVRTKEAKQDEYPYHAAAVVATDGNDRITLEVFARQSDAKEGDRNAPGTFEMYSVADNASTFHEVWKGLFGANPVTIVIKEG